MSLGDYYYEMSHCHRCSLCKFTPFQIIKSRRFAYGCPSIAFRNFHSWAAGGRVILAHAIVEGRLAEITETMEQIVFECTMCGSCQSQCRTYNYNLNPIEVMQELRTYFVEQGHLIPEHSMLVDALKREDNVFGEPKANRGNWAQDLDVKDINQEKADVFFHVGCRISYDQDFWQVARAAVNIMKKAGADIGIAGKDEACCGGRIYEMGYRGNFINYADDFLSRVKASGASKIVVMCADCNGTLKEYYPLVDKKPDVEILHISEYISRLLRQDNIRFTHKVPLRITYHDPCHLGRRGEPGVKWEGEYRRIKPHIFAPVPEKPIKLGLNGCYEAPREIIKSIPGIEQVEMERNRLFSWCCGAGAGVYEAFDDFASFSAKERIEEAMATGADALVTACPWCERNFKDTLESTGQDIKIYDIMELVSMAVGGV